ncbi:hypothetical protein GGR57DRAFT_372832 [Xylariaceae sp. FL1272]|nr:hypothetical protein GGR57DRAFT_372832 [Xylariaceae sp. FL1272]
MASTLLHLVPLISSTCSLYFAWDQLFFLSIFLKKDIRHHGSRLQASYWQSLFPTAAPLVIGLIAVTSSSSFYLLRTSADILKQKGAYNWYLACGSLALCHFLWVPLIKPVIDSLQDDRKDVDSGAKTLQRWLNIHLTRFLSVDIACWVSCTVATVKTLSVQ